MIRKQGKKRVAPWKDHWRSWYALERWRVRRAAQIRKEPLCAFCLTRGVVTPARVADHIVSHRGDWNAFMFGRLQSLCSHCHESVKRAPWQVLDADGWPIQPAPLV